ncbi:hypothetical protein GCM10022210_23500 [Mucilaginibacter dorajii]|uniref:Secretion system C-terminal sorting domain-containing protein n=2 Tax=Mucilaginibacter dorajii TaxID=692994 RepID=A0ABP7PX30_9SPHI
MISTITNFSIAGDVTVNSTVIGVNIILTLTLGKINGSFSLQGGTTTIGGKILTQSTFSGLGSAVAGTPTFYIEPGTGSSANLRLSGGTPIGTTSLVGSIDFYAGSGTCTVEYNSSGSQIVYTDLSTNTYLDTSPSVYQNLKFTGTGQKNIQSSNLTIAGDWASSGGKVDVVSNNPTVIFQGTAQNLSDTSSDSGNGVVFKNVNFQASGTKLISLGNFLVSSHGTLTMATASTTTLNANGLLTLKSDASSTATVAQMPTGCSITGNVNVQRFITGGSGYRGYRLMSSPVNISSSTTGGGNLSLAYLSTTQTIGTTTYRGALTGGPGSGFFVTNPNPTLYLYDESRTTDNTSFVSGKNVGIYGITGSTVTTTSGKPAVQTTGVSIPVGNSFLFYFIGDNSSSTVASSRVPDSTKVTAVGYLNQGNVPVIFWNTGSTSIPYHTGTGSLLPGYNQVGNPYASTISLDKVYAENYNSMNNAISPIFWELDAAGTTYISYDASNGHTSNTRASAYIVSGQGFIVDATGTSQTLTFKEDQKVSYPAITKSTTPALLMSTKNEMVTLNQSAVIPQPVNTGLHLQITKDSVTNAQCGIYFSKNGSDNYSNTEDAMDIPGASPKVYLSSYSADGVKISLNQMGDYTAANKKVKLFVKATTSGLYSLALADLKDLDTTRYRLYLVDHLKADSLDMSLYKTYAFNILTTDTATFGANRFELSIQQTSTSKYLLVTFTAQKANDGALVTWRTLNEGNNYAFILQKLGADGTSYSPVYQTQSNGGTIYKYTDKTPLTGNNTYRLKQVDLFGNITYSDLVSVNYDNAGSQNMFSLYPNPTAETLNVNVTYNQTNAAATSSYDLKIYDATGAVMIQKTAASTCWSENVSQFKPGLYIVELKNANGYSLGQAKFLKE